MIMRLFWVGFVSFMIISGTSVADAQPCLDCEAGQAVLSGNLRLSKFKHVGTGKLIDCHLLVLDRPVCMECDFIGGKKMIQEVQVFDSSGKLTLPSSGRHKFSGSLVPGETAWYCREVGLMVNRVDSAADADGGVSSPKDRFPPYVPGNGDLGYGSPTKVVTDVAFWNHATKDALASLGMTVTRVEYFNGGTYPVFFIREAPSRKALRYLQLYQKRAADSQAKVILKANANWPYEIVTEIGDRFRYNVARSSTGDGFEMFIDESSGFK
jgi:hypothetical protein